MSDPFLIDAPRSPPDIAQPLGKRRDLFRAAFGDRDHSSDPLAPVFFWRAGIAGEYVDVQVGHVVPVEEGIDVVRTCARLEALLRRAISSPTACASSGVSSAKLGA